MTTKYLVVVNTTPEKKIIKYQAYDAKSEADDHVLRVKDMFPNAFVSEVTDEYLIDYLIADVTNKTVTFDKVRWDSDQAVIASTQYQRDRAEAYPSIQDQLDDLYHNGIDGWKSTIKTTKDKYPEG